MRSKDQVRLFIARIVEEINKLLADDIRRAVTAAVDRRRHSPIPSAAALDYKATIRRNLKNYNPELKRLVPGGLLAVVQGAGGYICILQHPLHHICVL